MIRPQFKTENVGDSPIPKFAEKEYQSNNFLSGLVTDAAPDTIPDNALQLVKNVQYVKNQLWRRNGLQTYGLAKPDSNPVLSIFAFSSIGSGVVFLRVTKSSIYRATTAAGWVAVAGAGLNGTNNNPFYFSVADDRLFFSNDGVDAIQEIDPALSTYAHLGNAPKYRYIASAFNRLIGAYRKNVSDVPYEVGWSGDLNYGEWDGTVDISAGFTALVDSPSDLSDPITGIFSLTSCVCITREKSIWLATNLPSATQPFYFFTSVPRIGADTPRTIQVANKGLVFYNFQRSAVFVFIPNPQAGEGGGSVEEISLPVKRSIKKDITNPSSLFAAFNYDTNTYSLFIPSNTSSTVKCYAYNFDNKTWTYDEYNNISCCNDIDYASSTLTINDLPGPINGLAGTIDELGGLVANANRFFGFNSGELCFQPLFTGFQEGINDIILTDNGTPISSEITSKSFNVLPLAQEVGYLQITLTPYTTGNVSIYRSKDDGVTYTLYKTVFIPFKDLYKTKVILCRKLIKCNQYIWKTISTDCMFSLDSYYVNANESGLASK